MFIYLLVAGQAPAASKQEWQPVLPQELAETQPQIEPDAPAEILFWNMGVDDSDMPFRRRRSSYIRYKVYVPDKVEGITRVSQFGESAIGGLFSSDMDIKARLILPNGTIKEFGKEAIQERIASSIGGESMADRFFGFNRANVKEKFLAVPGVESGSILEIQVSTASDFVSFVTGSILQKNDIPVRKLLYSYSPPRPAEFGHRTVLINNELGHAELKEDAKSGKATVVARDIPSIHQEPLAGPRLDYSLAVLHSYIRHGAESSGRSDIPHSVEVDVKKDGPWSPISAFAFLAEEDTTQSTDGVRKCVKKITAGAATPLESAQRIHDFVSSLYQRYIKLPKLPPNANYRKFWYLDEVIECENNSKVMRFNDGDFMALSIALYREAGLEAHTIMLPDRRLRIFNSKQVSQAFVDGKCVGLKINGNWIFSYPHGRIPVSLGFLPWYYQGQWGLIAKEGKQEFIPIPLTPAESSMALTTGEFHLTGDEGDLMGTCKGRYSGQLAYSLREGMKEADPTRRFQIMKERLDNDIKGGEITVTKVEGIDEPKPTVDVEFTLRLPGYVTRTKNRLILRPSVFSAQDESLFSASVRHFPVVFPYATTETDILTVTIPEEYEPDALELPEPIEGDGSMVYRLRYLFDRSKHVLSVRRDSAQGVLFFPVAKYPALKAWNDQVDASDRHEITFKKVSTIAPSGGATPP